MPALGVSINTMCVSDPRRYFRRQGQGWGWSLGGGSELPASPLRRCVLFCWRAGRQVWEVSWTEVPRQLLEPCSPSQRHCSPAGHSAGGSMELWGAYLLLCLSSLLTQVSAEPPSPKVKNAKKGKEGTGRLPIFQGAGLGAHFPPLLGPGAPFPSG